MKPVDDLATPRAPIVEPFDRVLASHGLKLVRGKTRTLQVNVGYLCDLACRHCHLKAGPQRPEVMEKSTMDVVIDYASRIAFDTIDITGGAPELNPHIKHLVRQLAKQTKKLIVRTNLVALDNKRQPDLMDFYKEIGVALVASLPSTNASQADSQRGKGVWARSMEVLRHLNRLGYGVEGSGLELDLVVNPAGAFLPGEQCQLEKKFKRDLLRQGIYFTHLFSFANVPLGRFLDWLKDSGNSENYLQNLSGRFNPAAVEKLMCRSLISVSWDGYLYDCDFNLGVGLHHGAVKTHISELQTLPEEGVLVPTGDHCYSCTAGAGFT